MDDFLSGSPLGDGKGEGKQFSANKPALNGAILHNLKPYIHDKRDITCKKKGSTCVVRPAIVNHDFNDKYTVAGKPGRQYALKKIHSSNECYNREVKNLTKLKGIEHIVQIVDHYTCRGEISIVLEPWCDFALSAILDKKVLDVFNLDVAINFMTQIADAFVAIHEAKIKHGDIKPDNILILGNQVYVSDFGYSVIKASKSSGTAPGCTEWYKAPERHTHRVSDIWSLGVTFMEIVLVATNGKRNELRKCVRLDDNVKSLANTKWRTDPYEIAVSKVLDEVLKENLRALFKGMVNRNVKTRLSAVEVAERVRSLKIAPREVDSENSASSHAHADGSSHGATQATLLTTLALSDERKSSKRRSRDHTEDTSAAKKQKAALAKALAVMKANGLTSEALAIEQEL